MHAVEEDPKDNKRCDRLRIDKKDKYKAPLTPLAEEELTGEQALKTPILDRMLLRPSVISLPSLVTGASGKY